MKDYLSGVFKIPHKINTLMMKKTLSYLTMCLVISFLAVSCEPEEESFDDSLLIGKWQSGTLYYKYLDNGSGTTWDTDDDVTEAEAQAFTWTLVKSTLIHIHILEIVGSVPKIYTVTELTSISLKYHDDFGKNFSFTKATN
ncbi:MAG TPA: hypothetical protein VMV77_20535 [Bacteroidales bacterium]|nr:hypothetical protein [Bacteroidales bacterium]